MSKGSAPDDGFIPYYWPKDRAAGKPPPDDFEIDFATRCWQCKAIRCHCGTGGQWVDDVFMCWLCIRRFDLNARWSPSP